MEILPGSSGLNGSLLRDLELKRVISGSVSAVALSGVVVVVGCAVLWCMLGDVNASIDVEHAQTRRAIDVENFILYRLGNESS
mmetsp:Transcript_23917/g.58456  ORF Transcript_23917/g.58456 Transcript_23917/m.58456 type:complete len:83 (+) Transcript_23917:865-1113(+)